MSKVHYESITCPRCGKKSEFLLWDSINTSLDPEMKTKVRTGEAFAWTCPGCGHQAELDYPTLYHQMEDNIMIYYAPVNPKQIADALKDFVGLMNSGDKSGRTSVYRVVATKNQLREKLQILDAGMDDRVIEIQKAMIRVTVMQQNPEFKTKAVFFELHADGKMQFALQADDGDLGYVAYDPETYDKIACYCESALQNDHGSMIVDYNWALDFISGEE